VTAAETLHCFTAVSFHRPQTQIEKAKSYEYLKASIKMWPSSAYVQQGDQIGRKSPIGRLFTLGR
jgi:hypothetical protein